VRVGENAWLRAVGLELNDTTVFEPTINSSIGVNGDVFRRVALAETKSLHRSETRVLLVRTSQRRRNRRRPGRGRDRHGRKEQVDERRRNEGNDEG